VKRTILSLCDRSGAWSQPYADAGYVVHRIDLTDGQDIRLLERLPDVVHGILAAPPCTVFACSGNRWPRTPEQMIESLSVVDACLRAVVLYRPVWWALENPVGKLSRYLGPPTFTFQPCHFGDPWNKRTCLWGVFAPPIPDSLFVITRAVTPALGSRIHDRYGSRQERTSGLRSATPRGFARAFFEMNP
jgi:hypothetical protein